MKQKIMPIFPILTICGEPRDAERMSALTMQLVKSENIVLSMPHIGDMDVETFNSMHKAMIDMSDGLFVVGQEWEERTRQAIAYAESKYMIIVYVDTAPDS